VRITRLSWLSSRFASSAFDAISVNALMGFLAPVEYQDYLADFRDREPIGRAGYGIFIYEVK